MFPMWLCGGTIVGNGDIPRIGLPTLWFTDDRGEGPGDFLGEPPSGEEGRGGSHIDDVENSFVPTDH